MIKQNVNEDRRVHKRWEQPSINILGVKDEKKCEVQLSVDELCENTELQSSPLLLILIYTESPEISLKEGITLPIFLTPLHTHCFEIVDNINNGVPF